MSDPVSHSVTKPLTPAEIAARLITYDYLPPDNRFGITGSSDATKIARFEVDGLTTATTRVYTLGNATSTITSSVAILTNARLPKATAVAGIVSDSGIADGTSGGGVLTLAVAASYTITWVATGTGIVGTISTANRLTSVSAAGTIKESLVQDGVSAGALTLAKTGTTARTATFQDLAQTVAALESAQTFTASQAISAAAGRLTITDTTTTATAGDLLSLVTTSGGGLQVGVADRSAANPGWYLNLNTSETFQINNNGTLAWFVGSTGRMQGGFTTPRQIGSVTNGGKFHIEGTDRTSSSMSLVYNVNDANPGFLNLAKSRGAATGAVTIVQDADNVYSIDFLGADGVDMTTIGARIRATVHGTPGVGVIPMDLKFSCMTTGGTLSEVTRMDATGGVQIRTSFSTTSPGNGQLMVRGIQYDEQTVTSTGATAAIASDTSYIRCTGAALDMQGITAPTLGSRHIIVYFVNAATIRNQNAGASAANRIITGTGADVAATALSVYQFIYDQTDSRWRIC